MGVDEQNIQTATQPTLQPVPTQFYWTQPGSSVYLCGSFNNWRERIPMIQEQLGIWKVTRDLLPGKYQFKFIVDQTWRCSKDYQTVSEAGNINNVIIVQRPVKKAEVESLGSLFSNEIPLSLQAMWLSVPEELPRALKKTPLNAPCSEYKEQPYALMQLPEHVVLNHYYKKQKDPEYQICASTARIREKYVTVVLYRANCQQDNEIQELVSIFDQNQGYL
ncbi:5'-AMP-activated_protein kinase [Hexamita inflata]|uniref:Beta subunit n=1 Tax=Hexamita inflata TaxID=28002 RepID=A0AA86NPN2_9EUKA|nr:5'-AMP-activated protein kinase [Hexamita inflata]CAI9935615.1 5'-AMP-activated protein kinase [Hexamita inflata]CAI9949665.1 5'-AMP-activated protein kinase [Hexamita inflata]